MVRDTNDELKQFSRKIYEGLKVARICSITVSILLIFFTKPRWCEVRTDMSQDCDLDSAGNEYYINDVPKLPSFYGFIMETFTMLLVNGSYYIKVQYYKDRRRRMQRFYIMMGIVCLSIFCFIVRSHLLNTHFNSFFFIIFLMYRTKVIRRAIKRSFWIVMWVYPIFLLNLFIIGVLSMLTYLSEFSKQSSDTDVGSQIYDAPEFYTVNYASPWTSFITFMFLQTVNNSPDVIVQQRPYMLTLLFFYVSSTAINVLLLKSITLAVVNEAYRSALKKDVKIHKKSKRVASVIGNIGNFREADYKHVEKMLIGRGNGSLMVSILGGEHNRHSRNLLLESVVSIENSHNPGGTLGFGRNSTLALRKNSNDGPSLFEPIAELSAKSETNSGYRAYKLAQLKRNQDSRLRSGSST